MSDLRFVEFDHAFLRKSYEWLNDSEIKEMTNTPDFSPEEQKKWYESLKTNHNYLVWGIVFQDKPIGVCALKSIRDNKAEYIGYIGEKEHWGKGLGRKMLEMTEEIAKEIGIRSLHLEVSKVNSRAINLYLSEGYCTYDQNDDLFFMKKSL